MRPAMAVPDDVRDCKSRDRYEEEDDVEEDLDGADASANRPPCMELRAPILLLPFMLTLVLRGRRGASLMLHIMAEYNEYSSAVGPHFLCEMQIPTQSRCISAPFCFLIGFFHTCFNTHRTSAACGNTESENF